MHERGCDKYYMYCLNAILDDLLHLLFCSAPSNTFLAASFSSGLRPRRAKEDMMYIHVLPKTLKTENCNLVPWACHLMLKTTCSIPIGKQAKASSKCLTCSVC